PQGLALFDAAWRRPEAALVPARLDLAALPTATAPVPQLLRALTGPAAPLRGADISGRGGTTGASGRRQAASNRASPWGVAKGSSPGRASRWRSAAARCPVSPVRSAHRPQA
ncbi:hypothetical protein VM98_36730, partial [Streptomyces rubellomurinus subsp. indigoferus]